MTRNLSATALAAMMAGALATAASADAVYTTGFESSDPGTSFSTGNLNGQGGWSVTEGSATVDTGAGAQDGSQFVSQGSMSTIDLPLSAEGADSIFIEAWHKGAGTASPQLPPDSPLAASVLAFRSVDATNFTVACLDGDGTGNGSATFRERAPGTNFSPDAWTRVVLRVNYDTQLWDCLVAGHTYLSDLGFRDSAVGALSGFRSATEVGSSLDTMSVRTSDGDLDGDFYDDTYEILLDTDPTDPLAHPSLGDVNGDGLVNTMDVLLLYRIAAGTLNPGDFGYDGVQDIDQSGATTTDDAMLLLSFTTGDGTVNTLPYRGN